MNTTTQQDTQAAANKAAEEGELPIPIAAISRMVDEAIEAASKNGANSISMPDDYVAVAHFVCCPEQYIAADRASRQVANKAEVEPVAHLKFWARQSWSGNGNHDVENAEGLEVCGAGEIGDDGEPAFPVYTTPPATTGASTEELKRDAERHRYTRATTTAVRDPESGERIEVTPEMYDAAIDRAIADDPDFSKGIKSRHLVGASTVLTDLAAFAKYKGFELPVLNNHGEFHQDWLQREFAAFKAGRAIAREVAAQAGQVAVPSQSWEAIGPLPVDRDENGWWSHPAIPNFDEDVDSYLAWVKAVGLEMKYKALESYSEHPLYEAWFEDGETNASSWEPEEPSGDGWFTFSIHDSEDGPIWAWARRITTDAAPSPAKESK